MENLPCCSSLAGHQIATIFCTCHDSTAVVPCTKFCSNHCIRIEMRVKRNFHRIWIAMEKTLVKRGPGDTRGYGISNSNYYNTFMFTCIVYLPYSLTHVSLMGSAMPWVTPTLQTECWDVPRLWTPTHGLGSEVSRFRFVCHLFASPVKIP